MDSTAITTLEQQATAITKEVKRLLNRDLQEILKSENLAISGVKATLQARILERIQETITSSDYVRFYELRDKIIKAATPSSFPARGNSGSSRTYNPVNVPYSTGLTEMASKFKGNSISDIKFRDSPFYEIRHSITRWHELPVAIVNRTFQRTKFSLDASTIDILKQDHSLRVMLYCTSPSGPFHSDGTVDIAFPGQIDIKINGESLQANTRGIKKKPGTTKPADITALLYKRISTENLVDLTYVNTDRKFAFVIQLIKKRSIDELVDRIKNRGMISKQTVINEMITKANDPDIETTSTIMSLKCPLSAMRMEIPCRSIICNHNQCFDANSFLQVQEQAPQWSCPICNKTFKFQDLAIDQYVQDILNSTPRATEQITIEPDGTWRQEANDSFRVPDKRKAADAWEYDDLVEIHDDRANRARQDFSTTPLSYTKTPNSTSREASMGSNIPNSINGKRPVKDIIDLTLSDDEEEPPRPVKRQSMSSMPNPIQTLPQIPTPHQNGFTPFTIPPQQTQTPYYDPYFSPNYPPTNFGMFPGFRSQ